MYLLFLDESGTPPSFEKAEGKFFVIGGVIIHHEHFNEVFGQFETLKKKYNVNGEVKSVFFGMDNVKKNNSLIHLTEIQRANLREDIYNLINSNSYIHLIACAIDVHYVYKNEQLKSPNDIYNFLYKEVLGIFKNFLMTYSFFGKGISELGMVFSDHRMSHEDRELRVWHHELTDFTFESTQRTNLIIGSLHFIPSEFSPFLQLADMVAGAVFQKHQRRYKYFVETIQESFQIPRGSHVEFCGLKEILTNKTLSSGGET